MELLEIISWSIYGLLFLATFLFAFFLVKKNLARINIIENEKFDIGDWGAMTGFGALFSLAILFIFNITIEIIFPSTFPKIAGIILIILLSILVVYPLWEIFVLGRPTSDAVHDFHKFLESKILDKFRGPFAYIASFCIFLVIYIIPILAIHFLTKIDLMIVAFMWFLLFPLFFLNYFSAHGQISGIIGATYTHRFSRVLLKRTGMKLKAFTKIKNVISIIIAWSFFLLSFYNFFGPLIQVFSEEGYTLGVKSALTGLFSLVTTVPFGIKGFFQKFWQKKSKTKTIDYIFSGYIFIAISVSMLLTYVQINPAAIYSFFEDVPILAPLISMFQIPNILVPIIVIQSFITITYGSKLLFNRRTDFHADVRTRSTGLAYGVIDIETIVRRQATQEQKLLIDKENAKKTGRMQKKQKKIKKKKHNLLTLYKSLLLHPEFSRYGVDLNEQVRLKASQYLYLICVEEPEKAQDIIEAIFKNTLDPSLWKIASPEIQYISPESVNLLGQLGVSHPTLIMQCLIDAIEYVSVPVKRMILDALGDIGEVKENLRVILDKISPLFGDQRTDIRGAAFQAVTEMILEGQNQDKEFTRLVLQHIYIVFQTYMDEPEVIDTALEALVQMSSKIADDIALEKIKPFLAYRCPQNKEIEGYILQNTIVILGYMVYYILDVFPIDAICPFLEDSRSYIRYVTADTVGNYILKCDPARKEPFLLQLMELSLHDPDIDVVEMCAESVAEFLVMNKNFTPRVNNQPISILDYYTKALFSPDRQIAEHASETLKQISPLYDEVDIYPLLEPHLKGTNPELIRDCLEIIAFSTKEEHQSVHLDLLYELCGQSEASIRDKAIFTLGMISSNRPEIKPEIIFPHLDDSDPQVRKESIFALGKIGIQLPHIVIPKLIEKFYSIDRESSDFISEVELYAESLGVIGHVHPSNEIIVTLQSTLMGNTNPFAKDVISRALGNIGYGMIKSGKATSQIQDKSFLNRISWLKTRSKKEYTIGNLIIIFIEALQQKGIPSSVMNELSDSIQDLIPVFLFTKVQDEDPKKNVVLETIKVLLAQAYYSNYNSEILETIDRIDSMISFKRSFEYPDPRIQQQFIFYSKQYTNDGKQFFDQGMTFKMLVDQDLQYIDYALRSFEIAIEMTPFEFYAPECLMELGSIQMKKGNHAQARLYLEQAHELYASLDEIAKMKESEDLLAELPK